jgi:ATP phosphoribosyltransferase regulatory subunit
MPAFPTVEQDRIAALESISSALLSVFRARGYGRIKPSILQPSSIFVDRSGEEIRRRTLELTDPKGNELCLRPDLTIPACKYQVESGGSYPARLCYRGPAFRYSDGGVPTEFAQAGAELLGLEDRVKGETEMLSLAVEALRAVGIRNFKMIVGDLKLFATLVDSLEVPEQWRGRLKRHFWRTGYFEKLLARMVTGAANDAERAIEDLHALKPAELDAAIAALIDKEKAAPLAGRTRAEIAARLMLQASDGAAPRLKQSVADTILKFLAVRGSAHGALKEIRTLTKSLFVTMEKPIRAMEERLATLEKLGVNPSRISFVGHFGRNLEYYTGFVFEFWATAGGGALEVAGGGRYDTLMESLGAPRGTTAVGCALSPEKIFTCGGGVR